MRSFVILFFVIITSIAGCRQFSSDAGIVKSTEGLKAAVPDAAALASPVAAEKIHSTAEILAQKEVPILCYHQIREYRATDSKTAQAYIAPPNSFRDQIKLLADSGYKTILPDELNDYLVKGKTIPERSVMLTFDDTDASQFEVARAELAKYNFKAVFFIMTVSINRPGYMSTEQIQTLSGDGHVIGLHTWDHHNVKKYVENDWQLQIEKPKKKLEEITGKEVKYFAYPFGLWNEQAIPELQKRGIAAAFQLSTKRDQQDPLFTIRRIIVPGSWSPSSLYGAMNRSFQNKL